MRAWVIGGNKGGPEEVEITHVGSEHRTWVLGQTAFETEAQARAAYRESFLETAGRLDAQIAALKDERARLLRLADENK